MSKLEEIFGEFQNVWNRLSRFFNPIGQFYIKFQLLARVLVVGVFLDDLYEEPELECESAQVGCQLSCVNRFAPISQDQLWQFEMLVIFMSMAIFVFFSNINDRTYKKYQERVRINPKTGKYAQLGFYETKASPTFKVENVRSNLTDFGYVVMLAFRLLFEIICLVLEAQLAKHHSQNANLDEIFSLKEFWLCATNDRSPEKIRSTLEVFPQANRSSIFHRTDTTTACVQQQVTVTCWIPYSRMKTLGIKFMYTVLAFQTCITLIELVYEMLNICKRKAKVMRLKVDHKQGLSRHLAAQSD